MDDALIQALKNPKLYPHEVSEIEVLQTHISWVILTGQYAYKIKKPVNFGFCDFTTLEKRKLYCEMEFMLNSRLAPELYIHVVEITGSLESPAIDGDGPILDYAIKMHQFEQNRLLSNVHDEEGLSKALMLSLANQIAHFHHEADRVPIYTQFGTPEHVWAPVLDNFNVLRELEPSKAFAPRVDAIQKWAQAQFDEHLSVFESRKQDGFIKETHGDIHLGNIVLIQGKPVIFDCIEFNDDFRFTDTIADIAFLAMDLDFHGYENLSFFLCNHYFEATQDYQGLLLLDFYKSYRAMVRAKVTAIQIQGMDTDPQTKQNMQAMLERYITLAERYQERRNPTLTITFGASGSGKSTYTEEHLITDKAIRLRSDVIRKQMCGLFPYDPCPEDKKKDVYSEAMSRKVYERMQHHVSLLLASGWPVIVDATFLRQWQRDMFKQLALSHKIPFTILTFDQNSDLLKSRIEQRLSSDKTSDADQTVLEFQLDRIEPLTQEESEFAEYVT